MPGIRHTVPKRRYQPHISTVNVETWILNRVETLIFRAGCFLFRNFLEIDTMVVLTRQSVLIWASFLFLSGAYSQEYENEYNLISTPTDTASVMDLIRQVTDDMDNNIIETEQAISMFRKTLTLSRTLNFNNGIAYSLSNLGACYRQKGAYSESIALFREALPYCQKTNDKKLLAILYNNIGTSYYFLAKYDLSIYYYYKSITEIRRHNLREPVMLTNIYHNMGGIWLQLNDPYKALFFLNRAENIAGSREDSNSLAVIFSNKGSVYILKKDWEKARYYYLKAIDLGQKYQNTQALYTATSNLGEIYMREQMPEKAIAYLQEAISLSEQTSQYYHRIVSYYNLGEAYYLLKDYKRAEKNLLPALREAQKAELKENMAGAHATLAAVYAATGRYREAFEHQRMYTDMYLLKKENVQSIKQLELKYRNAEQDRVIAEHKLLIAHQQTALMQKNAWLMSISICSALLIFITMVFYINRQRRMAYKMRIMKQEEEIKSWQATIKGEEKERARIAYELHDGIGGQLSTVSMYFGTIQKKYPVLHNATDYKEALSLLLEALTDVRKTAHNLMPELLLRHGLAEAIRLFCKKIQRAQKLNIDFQYYGFIGRLSSNFELSVYRIVQELMQNILKHAKATEVLVQLSQHDNILSITVEDNGAGIEQNGNGHSGLGLRSIEARTKGLNGSVNIHSTPGNGTAVYLEFDLEIHQNPTPKKKESGRTEARGSGIIK